jgi:hypothetical protein
MIYYTLCGDPKRKRLCYDVVICLALRVLAGTVVPVLVG